MQNYNKKIKINRKFIGEVRGGTFFKRIKGWEHFLRVHPAIAFDNDSLTQYECPSATKVCVTDVKYRIAYLATIDQIREKGKRLNCGFGDQFTHKLDYHNKNKRVSGNQRSLFWK